MNQMDQSSPQSQQMLASIQYMQQQQQLEHSMQKFEQLSQGATRATLPQFQQYDDGSKYRPN